MNKAIFGVASFVLGAAAGSFVTWKTLKDKYAQIAQDEIDSVKEVYSRREKSVPENVVEKNSEDDFSEKEKNEYKNTIKHLDYTSYSKPDKNPEIYKESEDTPYVIKPEEFGEFDEYEQISLTFWADQIITDDEDDILEEVNRVIGFESLNHFGEYEDDSVYVRNDRLKCDYEILLDQRKYEDVIKQ